ncbi:ras and ef-hand domain-containing protein [Anaeramoeba flamelloides]|uniref:Ras and ef-hand domain-containing protein n=1 Tax=Anaeramoeba flamelloides TaxID=1746091 RepID=A0AAV7ZZC3_9EUKA|nr:ras and ef-hand domain-containing protein [Anaeramoeba flamelloides]KAJ6251341.1 ras and ef-hand domain-containing protein [Anaeramoeba flamelloides]
MSLTPQKLVLLGESGVGKSSIAIRYFYNKFNSNIEATIGATFINQTVQVSTDYEVRLQIWDTAGQERYHSLTLMYFRGAKGVIIVFDVTNQESFYKAQKWFDEILHKGLENSKVVLVGNKIDCETNDRKVEKWLAEEYATENGIMYCETSAKTGEGVKEMFFNLAKELPIIKQQENSDLELSYSNTDTEDSQVLETENKTDCC